MSPDKRSELPETDQRPAFPPAEDDLAATEADRNSSDADQISSRADAQAAGRDEAAADREVASAARDAAAAARDEAAEELERAQGPGGPLYEAAILLAKEVRAQAAADRELAAADRAEATAGRIQANADRERAARDREHAAMDREHAAMDRRQAIVELERAHNDDLTGAYRRRAGLNALQAEIDRSRRGGESLILAFIDVDGLKATNDSLGHIAGDDRLRELVLAIRSKTRSYEPIVRYGGDEFICSFAGVDQTNVEKRFAEIQAVLTDRGNQHSISYGLAELRPDESLDSLINRADEELISSRVSSDRARTDQAG